MRGGLCNEIKPAICEGASTPHSHGFGHSCFWQLHHFLGVLLPKKLRKIQLSKFFLSRARQKYTISSPAKNSTWALTKKASCISSHLSPNKQLFHSWRKMRFYLIGLIWLRNDMRKLLKSIMSLPRHGSFLIPNPETFLSLNRIRMSPTTLMGLSLTKKWLVTMSHETCSLLKCSPQFMPAFPVIWTRLEYLRLKILSNTPYCLLPHHLAIEKWLFYKVTILRQSLVS